MSYSVEREVGFDFLSAEYAELHAAAAATAFQHGLWLHRLYTTLAPARGARPVVVTVRRESDRKLVLVLPLVSTGRFIRTLTFADLGVADYNVAVASRPVLEELGRRPDVVAGIRRALGRFDLLRVDRVPDSPDAVAALFAGARVRRHHYNTHVMTLESTTEAWRKTLDAAFVRHLERASKRLRPKGKRTLREAASAAEVETLMHRLGAFRAARFAERRGVDLMQDQATLAFYRAVAADSVSRGGPARLVALELSGEPAAIAFNLVETDRELLVLVGYDVERLRNYSLGLVIVDSLVQDAIGRGKSYFDLTVGDEPYKSDFAARSLPLHQVRVPRTLRGWAALVGADGMLSARRVAKRALLAWQARKARRAATPAEASAAAPR
jgi:CelD/BcsL family acetyltransferase involved in cellulose biosynthesis